ncbi:fumarylacetoacetate hydrolase family protein [Sphingobium sp. SCG-1]|uniref:fumarylacetoacetate hydrolase family protein n=1 Tax=Sphingobium sp. SCG-1 TaxID=2072936 RepID=UPI00166FD7B8|nr:fumarylacetoacetate hydrolase family protein [Sphingobium sp. SCG-1]
MGELYRLAVSETTDGARQAVIEYNGQLLPVDAALGERFETITDLQPLLDQWNEVDTLIADYVQANTTAFSRGGPVGEATLLAPLAAPGKILCIGSNYHDHIAEMPIPMTPTYPYSFLKPTNNTVRGTGDSVAVPRRVSMMDWEAELGVVISTKCQDVTADQALQYVAGYLNFNDLSARDWLASKPPVGVDWVQHKAFDGFAPMGPYLVPARFVADPQDLPVRLTVNGKIKQDSNTREMVFGVAAIIEHASSIMTLYPGDVIATGTPAGVGHGRKPPEYLSGGDEVRVVIGQLGELVTYIV